MNEKTVVIGLPMLLQGGTEIQTLALLRVLRENGYRVIVCCYYEYENGMAEEFRKEGAELVFLNLARMNGRTTYGQMFRLLLALRRFFRSTKPHAAHIQYVAPGFIPIIAARLAGVKRIFVTIHYPRHSFGKKEVLFVRLAARLSTRFFCNSLATERSWFGTGMLYSGDESVLPSSHRTVYNAVDINKVERRAHFAGNTSLKSISDPGTNAVVGVVARLRSEKGHALLFNAMKQVLRSAPKTTLVVVGDGPDKDALMKLAERLEISHAITWLGAKPQEATFELYGTMNVVVVPSLFEGFGLSAAEGMAAGLPVIAANVDGLQEVVLDGVTGILFPPGDVEALASSILSLLADTDKATQMGKRGRTRVEELFSLERFRKAITAAYEPT